MPESEPQRHQRRHDHLRLGRHGEDLVAQWYRSAGHEVIDRNWRCAQGELDLVVRDGSTIVFCEVKTRSSLRYGSPFEAVDHTRRRRLRAAASLWLRECGPSGAHDVRFDVAGVVGNRIEVIRGAF